MDEVIIIPDTEDVADEIEDTGDEIEALSEQLAAHATASESRHTEIIQGVEQCRTRLETLSSAATMESPALIQISSQLVALQGELLNLRTLFLESQNEIPQPIILPSEPPIPEILPGSPSVEPSTDELPDDPPVQTNSRKTQRMA